jgi:hypothetical protein
MQRESFKILLAVNLCLVLIGVSVEVNPRSANVSMEVAFQLSSLPSIKYCVGLQAILNTSISLECDGTLRLVSVPSG